jgi:hypothetical protein
MIDCGKSVHDVVRLCESDEIKALKMYFWAHQHVLPKQEATRFWTGQNDMLHSNTAIPITTREVQVNSEITALYNF